MPLLYFMVSLVELFECGKGHYSEITDSGRCKDCISEYNEEITNDVNLVKHVTAKSKFWNKRKDVQENRFDHSIKHRNSLAKMRLASAGAEEIVDFTPEQIKALVDKQENSCKACFISFEDQPFEIDHINPVGLFSSNDISNLQLLCKACNIAKGNLGNDAFFSEIRTKQIMQYLLEIQEEDYYAT